MLGRIRPALSMSCLILVSLSTVDYTLADELGPPLVDDIASLDDVEMVEKNSCQSFCLMNGERSHSSCDREAWSCCLAGKELHCCELDDDDDEDGDGDEMHEKTPPKNFSCRSAYWRLALFVCVPLGFICLIGVISLSLYLNLNKRRAVAEARQRARGRNASRTGSDVSSGADSVSTTRSSNCGTASPASPSPRRPRDRGRGRGNHSAVDCGGHTPSQLVTNRSEPLNFSEVVFSCNLQTPPPYTAEGPPDYDNACAASPV